MPRIYRIYRDESRKKPDNTVPETHIPDFLFICTIFEVIHIIHRVIHNPV